MRFQVRSQQAVFRAFQHGVLAHQLEGFFAGEREEFGVADDVGDAELEDAGLFRAVELAGAAEFQVDLRDAEAVVHQNDIAARDSVSGVNLDEEAANMLRYQQAYAAAAQIIAISGQLFDELINAVRR